MQNCKWVHLGRHCVTVSVYFSIFVLNGNYTDTVIAIQGMPVHTHVFRCMYLCLCTSIPLSIHYHNNNNGHCYGAWSLAKSKAKCARQKDAEKCINTYNGQNKMHIHMHTHTHWHTHRHKHSDTYWHKHSHNSQCGHQGPLNHCATPPPTVATHPTDTDTDILVAYIYILCM